MRDGDSGNHRGNIHFVGVIIVSVIPVQIVKPAYPTRQQYEEKEEDMRFTADPRFDCHGSDLDQYG